MNRKLMAVTILLGLACASQARAEAILQYFNTSWNEIATRMPEVAEAGYTALWLPPPFIAGEQNSVGYDTVNRFDYGTSAATLYGTASDLLNLVTVAHRFGIRVYFSNVMNQNGGALPDTPPGTLSNTQPGFVPEDFHLIVVSTNPPSYTTLPSANEQYTNEWQDLYLNQFGIDIAQETPLNGSFGPAEGDTYPKFSGIRQPNNPELYPDTNATYVTDLNGNRFYPFDGHGQPVPEDVNGMLIRAVRWFVDQSKCDGIQLDDVKGVPSYFFGDQGYTGDNKDISTSGYCGSIQAQFNITHGFNSWSNLRASLFDDQLPRVNAMMWGEALGQPTDCSITCEQNYIDAGMRIDDNTFYSAMFGAVCGGCGNGLWHLDQTGDDTWGQNEETSLIHDGVQDYNFANIYDRTSANALLLTRAGLPSVYTDGYNESTASNPFPDIGDNAFLGQFVSGSPPPYLPNLCYINQLFARGNQNPKWSDQNYVAYERLDFRENSGMSTSSAAVLLFMLAQNGSGGQSRSYSTSFPAGARLKNYSTYNNAFGFGATVGSDGVLRDDSNNLIIAPAGGYWAFSWNVPGMPAVWNDGIYDPEQPIMILQNGQQAGTMTCYRHDGVNGDPNFNPYDVTNAVPGSYQYPWTVPCITSPSNLTFIARADGSCANILMKLDGGIDLNSQMGLGPQSGDLRDNRPGLADDVFLGYEQMGFVQRVAEMFAAEDVSRNIIGSPGCETYYTTIGSTNGFGVNYGSGPNTSIGTVDWAWHNPASDNQAASNPTTLQFNPPPQNAAGQPITVWVKIGYTNEPQYAMLYYTTNGVAWPDGSAGLGKGTTLVAPLAFATNGAPDNLGTPVWWTATLPAMPSGTVLRYKIGVYRTDASPWFPFSSTDVALEQRMESIYQITNFNAATVGFYPHNDYGVWQNGLDEGFHVLRTKTFLQRDGEASIYNLNVQTFYYDTRTPQGQILFPANGTTITGSNYDVVVRADRSTSAVWYRITDGNGTGQWAQATAISPSTVNLNTTYPLEWRFNYANIPTSGMAQIQARLLRLTSSTNMNFTDVAGHFTTLSTLVGTGHPGDSVGDGIPDWWRAQYYPNVNPIGQTTNNQSCATCDADGTGQNNLVKYLAGLNPTNSAAYLHIISVATINSNTDIRVTYLGANGDSSLGSGIQSRTNVLEYSTGAASGNYSNNFASTGQTNILSGGVGLGVVTNMVDTGGATNVPSRYYRVRVLLP